MLQKNISVLRIFDIRKAKEFYIDWLGFKIDWEHQFEPDTPYYIGISRDQIEIHLSEHYGDGTPGSLVFIVCREIEKFFNELQSRPYKYFRPGLEKTFYDTLCLDIKDPFGNKLSFNQYLTKD
jgi:catechol 2,3-dioxygenase-like lactoylglutathione lyase family enzyme